MTEEQLKKLHTAMQHDNEHQCNRLNNYIHTDEYLTAEVVQVVREIVNEETEELQEQIDKMKRCEICKHYSYLLDHYQCNYHSLNANDCKSNGMKLFELKEIKENG